MNQSILQLFFAVTRRILMAKYYYPPGIILAFKDTCPTGWSSVSAFTDKFLKGAATYGATGGGGGHNHSFDPGVTTSGAYVSSLELNDSLEADSVARGNHTHSINRPLATSATSTTVPPWLGVIFCKKD
jgi:hypothetical protein